MYHEGGMSRDAGPPLLLWRNLYKRTSFWSVLHTGRCLAEASVGPGNYGDKETDREMSAFAQSDVDPNRVLQLSYAIRMNCISGEHQSCIDRAGNKRGRGQCNRSRIDLIYGVTSTNLKMLQHGLALQSPTHRRPKQWCQNQPRTCLYTKSKFSDQRGRSYKPLKHFQDHTSSTTCINPIKCY